MFYNLKAKFSSALQPKSREKVGNKIWNKGVKKYKIHHNVFLEIRQFTLNKQDNNCDNSTS